MRHEAVVALLGLTVAWAVQASDPELAKGKAAAATERAKMWVSRGDNVKAIKALDEAIQLNPTNAENLTARGTILTYQGEFEKAMKDFDAAIKVDPQFGMAFFRRGMVWSVKGELTKAIKDYDQMIRLHPKDPYAYINRGTIRLTQGHWDLAIKDLDTGLRLSPENTAALSNRALLLAACPNPKYRDGKKALEDAKRACKLTEWKDPDALAVLAAAYAEVGMFEEAIKWQKSVPGNDKAKQQLELYKARKPLRLQDR